MTTFDACLSQLEALIEIENAALERMDVDAVAALTAEKHRLASTIRELAFGAKNDEAALRRTEPMRKLSGPMETNKILLERGMLVQRRLMAIVVAAATPKAHAYGRGGSMDGQNAFRPQALVAEV